MRISSFLSAICLITSACNPAEPPNVVFILVDDLGWKDLGVYGSEYYQTPNIDQLATEGIRYTDAYSACTVCSPTRAAIMTGKYPATINCTDWIEGWKYDDKPLQVPDWTMYMDTAEYTLAEAFRDNGYTTAHIGKWHLGEDSIFWPGNQGFALNIGGWKKGAPNRREGLYNGYFPPFGNPRLKDQPGDEYLTERLADEAVQFIEDSNPSKTGKPFFLNFWSYSVHTPLQAKQDKTRKYESLRDTTLSQHNATYAAMVEHMDDAVGRILQALKDNGVYENTIIIFTSDNGGLVGRWKQKVTNNTPLRNGKGHMYEGGVRVPLIIRIPGSPAETSNAPAISMDFYPTLMKLTGSKVPDRVSASFEGKNLFGDQGNKTRDLFWHYPHYHAEGATPYSAIRSGRWKLIYFYETGTSALYDLEADLSETTDLSQEQAEMKNILLKKLNDWKQEVNAQLPTKNINHQMNEN